MKGGVSGEWEAALMLMLLGRSVNESYMLVWCGFMNPGAVLEY